MWVEWYERKYPDGIRLLDVSDASPEFPRVITFHVYDNGEVVWGNTWGARGGGAL